MAASLDDLALDHAELRLAEMAHRTANILQMVGSLLNRAAAAASERRSADALIAAVAQIQAFALLGEQLGRSDAAPCAAAYLDALADHLEAACLRPRGIALARVLPAALPLDVEACRTLGLIVAEAVMNAVKHAFDADGGRLALALAPLPGGGCRCTLADDGRGYSETASQGRGTQFMAMLARSAGGYCATDTGPAGTTIDIVLRSGAPQC